MSEIGDNAADCAERWTPEHVGRCGRMTAFSRHIAAHEEPPVDPLLIEARKLCDDAYPQRGAVAGWFINGGGDGTISMRLALAALKRGMELAAKANQRGAK